MKVCDGDGLTAVPTAIRYGTATRAPLLNVPPEWLPATLNTDTPVGAALAGNCTVNIADEAAAMEPTDAGAMIPFTPLRRTEVSVTFCAASRPLLPTASVATILPALSRVRVEAVNNCTDVVGA